ncbi:MAG: hypothetical protein KY476_12075 [Planctomycetes bacterium]|nr:hypothetical protein [Planctomycetota bacterium]
MALTVNTNISALIAQTSLQRSNNRISETLGRLSTGLRINSSADDPSGLVLSEFQRAQIAGLSQAISNIDRAVAVTQTADGGLSEVSGLLTELRGLVIDSANNGALDRQSLEANQQNVTSILDTIDRIALSSQFGQQQLLDGTSGRQGFVSRGASPADIDFIRAVNDDVVTNTNLPIEVTQNAERAFVTAGAPFGDGTGRLAQGERLIVNGVEIELAAGLTIDQAIDEINSFSGQTEAFAVEIDFAANGPGSAATPGGGTLEIRSTQFGLGAQANVISNVDVALSPGGSGFSVTGVSDFGQNAIATIGAGIAGSSGSIAGSTETIGRLVTGLRGAAGSGLTIELGVVNDTDVRTAAVTAANNASVLINDNSRVFHVGAPANDNASLTLPTVESKALGLGILPKREVDLQTVVTPNTVIVGGTPVSTNGPVTVVSNQIGLPAQPTGTTVVTTAPVTISNTSTSTFNSNTVTNQVGNQIIITTTDVTTTVTMLTQQTTTTSTIVTANPGAIQAISDDFDPQADPGTFPAAGLSNGRELGAPAGEFFSGNAFYFDGPGNRFATTDAFNASAGGNISFVLKIGGPTDAQETATFENADNGEDIVLEFSANGGPFTNIATFDTEDANFAGTFGSVNLAIPAAAQTTSTVFRIRQVAHSNTGFDNWAIDNFNLTLNGVDRRVEEFNTTIVTTGTQVDTVVTVQTLTLSEDQPPTPNLRSIDVRNADAALRALKIVDRSIEEVNTFRGQVGAFQRNVLETAQSNVRQQFVNLSDAESVLRDVDFTTEITNLVSEQVRQNVATTIQGLANSNPLSILDLLQGGTGGGGGLAL